MKKQMLGAGIFILTLCCGLLVWGTGKYLKTDWTPDFQKLKSTNNGNQLTAEMRDELMDGLSKMQQGQGSSQAFDPKYAKWDIPKGAIMAFNLSSCPEWWSRFAEADGRFIMGSNSNIRGKGGNSDITLSINQLPAHSFYTVMERDLLRGMSWEYWWARDGKRDWSINSESKGEKRDDWNEWYSLEMTKWRNKQTEANAGKTNTIWNGQSINIQNPYIKLLYCQKD